MCIDHVIINNKCDVIFDRDNTCVNLYGAKRLV